MKAHCLVFLLLLPVELVYCDWNNRLSSTTYSDIVVRYDMNIGKLIDSDFADDPQEPVYTIHRFIETKLENSATSIYLIDWYPGPSEDPTFIISMKSGKDEVEVGGINAKELIIPGNGYIYSSGHTNNMFNTKKKYKIENEKLVEIKQPFYYVGLESFTLMDTVIYRDVKQKQEVARLPKNTKVKVLVSAEDDYYLISTDFGLTGWLYIYPGQNSRVIEGMYYAGD